jgi:hypothetical protein
MRLQHGVATSTFSEGSFSVRPRWALADVNN